MVSSEVYLISLISLENDGVPLYQQVYDGIQQAILQQQITAGTRLPSSRELAQLLGVSRNTVLNAYDQLEAEGYLEKREKSGTFVSRQLPEDLLNIYHEDAPTKRVKMKGVSISGRGKRYESATFSRGDFKKFAKNNAFTSNLPALDQFPYTIWAQLANSYYRYPFYGDFGYTEAEGYPVLREAIATYLTAARSVQCTPDQIIIISGSQQGIFLATQVLLDPGDQVWMEEPGYLGAKAAFQTSGAEIVPVPVDDYNQFTEIGTQLAPKARMAYITPSHQFPLGHTMDVSQRIELLNHAQRHDMWIIEDDYDSEYRYAGHPIASLQGLDTGNRVIYVGTFSKVLFPGVRIGYLVVPPELVSVFTQACRAIHDHTNRMNQVILAQFITEGHFARHIRRMRKLYHERRDALVTSVEKHLDGLLSLVSADAGMDVLGWLAPNIDEEELYWKAGEAGINVQPVSPCYMSDCPAPGIILGYSGVHIEHIDEGVQTLKRVLLDVRH